MTSDAQILARPAAVGDTPDPRRWLTLVILLLAAFMNLLDVSIVNIAIPSIQRNLHASYADVQWALAGYTLAYERLPQEVELLYFPQDFPWSVRHAYDLIQPDFIVLMESELWPNHIWTGARRGVPLFLVNGRMSARSKRRYKQLGALPRLASGPALEGAFGGVKRGFGVIDGGTGDRGNLPFSCRIDHVKSAAIGGLAPFAANPEVRWNVGEKIFVHGTSLYTRCHGWDLPAISSGA